jgi:Holliday junction resolvase RusA-like endonuclease
VITFRVNGIPIPQGSMKVINGRVLHSQGSALAVWRSLIGWEAKSAGASPHSLPVKITISFFMPRPKTVKRAYPSVAPDLDKLVRAVLDGLTGVAYEDDGQVVQIHARKLYGAEVGAEIELETIKY